MTLETIRQCLGAVVLVWCALTLVAFAYGFQLSKGEQLSAIFFIAMRVISDFAEDR